MAWQHWGPQHVGEWLRRLGVSSDIVSNFVDEHRIDGPTLPELSDVEILGLVRNDPEACDRVQQGLRELFSPSPAFGGAGNMGFASPEQAGEEGEESGDANFFHQDFSSPISVEEEDGFVGSPPAPAASSRERQFIAGATSSSAPSSSSSAGKSKPKFAKATSGINLPDRTTSVVEDTELNGSPSFGSQLDNEPTVRLSLPTVHVEEVRTQGKNVATLVSEQKIRVVSSADDDELLDAGIAGAQEAQKSPPINDLSFAAAAEAEEGQESPGGAVRAAAGAASRALSEQQREKTYSFDGTSDGQGEGSGGAALPAASSTTSSDDDSCTPGFGTRKFPAAGRTAPAARGSDEVASTMRADADPRLPQRMQVHLNKVDKGSYDDALEDEARFSNSTRSRTPPEPDVQHHLVHLQPRLLVPGGVAGGGEREKKNADHRGGAGNDRARPEPRRSSSPMPQGGNTGRPSSLVSQASALDATSPAQLASSANAAGEVVMTMDYTSPALSNSDLEPSYSTEELPGFADHSILMGEQQSSAGTGRNNMASTSSGDRDGGPLHHVESSTSSGAGAKKSREDLGGTGFSQEQKDDYSAKLTGLDAQQLLAEAQGVQASLTEIKTALQQNAKIPKAKKTQLHQLLSKAARITKAMNKGRGAADAKTPGGFLDETITRALDESVAVAQVAEDCRREFYTMQHQLRAEHQEQVDEAKAREGQLEIDLVSYNVFRESLDRAQRKEETLKSMYRRAHPSKLLRAPLISQVVLSGNSTSSSSTSVQRREVVEVDGKAKLKAELRAAKKRMRQIAEGAGDTPSPSTSAAEAECQADPEFVADRMRLLSLLERAGSVSEEMKIYAGKLARRDAATMDYIRREEVSKELGSRLPENAAAQGAEMFVEVLQARSAELNDLVEIEQENDIMEHELYQERHAIVEALRAITGSGRTFVRKATSSTSSTDPPVPGTRTVQTDFARPAHSTIARARQVVNPPLSTRRQPQQLPAFGGVAITPGAGGAGPLHLGNGNSTAGGRTPGTGTIITGGAGGAPGVILSTGAASGYPTLRTSSRGNRTSIPVSARRAAPSPGSAAHAASALQNSHNRSRTRSLDPPRRASRVSEKAAAIT